MSAVLELAYDKIKKCSSAYSVEATSASLAVIKFYTTKIIRLGQELSSFTLCCKCCEQNVFKQNRSFRMADIMEYLPDAMFYHTLSNVIGEDRIKNYLFDKNFDCSNLLPCTKLIM